MKKKIIQCELVPEAKKKTSGGCQQCIGKEDQGLSSLSNRKLQSFQSAIFLVLFA